MSQPGLVEIEYSRVQQANNTVLGLLLTGASLFLALGPARELDETQAQVVGYVGAIAPALLTVRALSRLATAGPVLTLTGAGICDLRIAPKTIRWSAIRGITAIQGGKALLLDVDPAVEAGLTLTPDTRWFRRLAFAHGMRGLCIALLGLKSGHHELLGMILAHAEAAWSTRSAERR